eukprot:scaffold214259_cov31-Tisochrysis_lutea.AAC.2
MVLGYEFDAVAQKNSRGVAITPTWVCRSASCVAAMLLHAWAGDMLGRHDRVRALWESSP